MPWREMSRSRLARVLAIVAGATAVAAAGLAAVPQARAGAGAPIVGAGGRCVDVTWSGTADGTPVQLYDCNGTDAQNWAADGAEGPIRALGKCLDVTGGAHDDDTPVQLFTCNGTGAQAWRADAGRLVNTASGKCLDAVSGAPLRMRTCNGAPTQAWTLAERPAAPPPAAKKGVATWQFPRVADGVREVGATWYHDWSVAGDDVPAEAEFVPVIWGAANVTDADLATAQRYGRTLLGFNEPDLAEQANMSVEQALDLWPRLQATGLRLGSPAVAFGGDTPGMWLDRFMSGARERGLRVDFIALHWYGSDFGDAAADHLMQYVRAVHDRYGLPIWVTEFGLIDHRTKPPVYASPQQLAAFISRAVPELERASYVERYAWFGLPATGDHAPHGLYREDGAPTEAGAAYRSAGG